MTDGENEAEHPKIDVTEEDPYADVDLSELPAWWRKAVEEFREYGLRTYHPPVFEDGVYKHRVVKELEERLEINVDFIGTEVPVSDEWTVRVDKHPVGTIAHSRAAAGYSVYEMDSDEFHEWILDHVLTVADGDE